ncbi:MAG: P-loop NTPase, partial [Pseudomonadota bacterium]
MNEAMKKQKPVRVISVTSGKGGVGKSFIITNLGVFLAKQGFKVCILDADIGLANVHLMLGLSPQKDISDVLKGNACIKDIMLHGPHGLLVIPGGSGFADFSNMNNEQKGLLLDVIDGLPDEIDYLLIDTSAGIHSNVTFFNAAASEIIVVVNSEPPSIYDAYAAIKILHTDHQVIKFSLLIN